MATQLLFYGNAVPVNSTAHRDLSVRPVGHYGFASKVNSVPLMAAEFVEAAATYPIVFAGEGEAVIPSVVLGLAGARNAFLDAEGKWSEGYVPGFIRRYPFVFSNETEDGRLVLHVDEEFEGCNREGRGERLFDSEGEQTAYLKSVLAFLQSYQASFSRTQGYCKRLADLDLLRPVEAGFTMADGERKSMGGFRIVDQAKLKELPSETLLEMFRTDELEITYAHLHSLRHFGKVAEKTQGVTKADGADIPTPDMGESDDSTLEPAEG